MTKPTDEGTTAKKDRKPKSPSTYMLVREFKVKEGADCGELTVPNDILEVIQRGFTTPTAAWKHAEDNQCQGKLGVLCERGWRPGMTAYKLGELL